QRVVIECILANLWSLWSVLSKLHICIPGEARGRGQAAMTFGGVVDQALAMLQRRGRVTYRLLQRHFRLDDAALEDLKEELIYGQRVAVDEEERVLVWQGETASAAPAASVRVPAPDASQAHTPLAYTPPH